MERVGGWRNERGDWRKIEKGESGSSVRRRDGDDIKMGMARLRGEEGWGEWTVGEDDGKM